MTNNQEYLNQLFETARSESPIVSLGQIAAAVEAHAATGISIAASGKYKFLSLKNGFIGFISAGVLTTAALIYNPNTEDKKELATIDIIEQEVAPVSNDLPLIETLPELPEQKEEVALLKTMVDTLEIEVTPTSVATPSEPDINLKTSNDNIVIVLGSGDRIVVDDLSVSADSIVTGIKSDLRKRYYITENTTKEDLNKMVEELSIASIEMTFNNLNFNDQKLLRFAIELKKGKSVIKAKHTHKQNSNYKYEFGWKMTEDGEFLDFYTISCHEQEGHVCIISNDCQYDNKTCVIKVSGSLNATDCICSDTDCIVVIGDHCDPNRNQNENRNKDSR